MRKNYETYKYEIAKVSQTRNRKDILHGTRDKKKTKRIEEDPNILLYIYNTQYMYIECCAANKKSNKLIISVITTT